jgi:hypothetical protein
MYFEIREGPLCLVIIFSYVETEQKLLSNHTLVSTNSVIVK